MTPTGRAAAVLVPLVATYAALCVGLYAVGDPLVQSMAPVFKAEIHALRPELRVDELRVERATVHLTIRRTTPPRQILRASSSSSVAFTYPILVLSLLAAWPFATRRRRLVALAAAGALLLAAMLVDLPVLLLLTVAEATDGREPFVLFLYNNGGRQLLALLIFAASLAVSRHLAAPRPAEVPSAPPVLRPRRRRQAMAGR